MTIVLVIMWAVADAMLLAALCILSFKPVWEGVPSLWARWRAKRKSPNAERSDPATPR